MRVHLILWLNIANLFIACNSLPLPTPAYAPRDTTTDFQRALEFDSVSFLIKSSNSVTNNSFSIQPAGMSDNTPVIQNIDGRLYDAKAADLNRDGFPELYCSVACQDGTGKLFAWASNKNKSLTPIYIPEVTKDKLIGDGYLGNDGFSIDSNYISHSFPVYTSGNSVASATGGVRTIRYQLVAGEGGWVLRIVDIKDQK